MDAVYRKNKTVWLFMAAAIIYLVISMATRPDSLALARYHLSELQARLLALTILLPYMGIWAAAMMGYVRLKQYSQSIAKDADGEAFRLLTRGLLWLAIWLPVSGLVSAATNYVATNKTVETANLVRVGNYLNLIILFVGFYLVYQGSRRLGSVVSLSRFTLQQGLAALGAVFLAGFYVFLSLHNPARQVGAEGVRIAAYYLPDWLALLTIIVPRVVMWGLGFMAVRNIYLYARDVKGPIYRRALSGVAVGISLVIVSSIFIRYTETLAVQLNRASVQSILLVYYLFLLVLAAGYVYVAKGAKSLLSIEEV